MCQNFGHSLVVRLCLCADAVVKAVQLLGAVFDKAVIYKVAEIENKQEPVNDKERDKVRDKVNAQPYKQQQTAHHRDNKVDKSFVLDKFYLNKVLSFKSLPVCAVVIKSGFHGLHISSYVASHSGQSFQCLFILYHTLN